MEEPRQGDFVESRKPFAFFDLGETIVDLTDTIQVLARSVTRKHHIAPEGAVSLATEWFIKVADSIPRAESQQFETMRELGSRVLADLLGARGVSVDGSAASRLLRGAWDEWQMQARLCEGVTKEWLDEIRGLSASVGAITDGDEDDVSRLLEDPPQSLFRFGHDVGRGPRVQTEPACVSRGSEQPRSGRLSEHLRVGFSA